MKHLARLGLLVGAMSLVVSTGCDKSKAKEQTEPAATDQPGLTSEKVLVLKFHHDS